MAQRLIHVVLPRSHGDRAQGLLASLPVALAVILVVLFKKIRWL